MDVHQQHPPSQDIVLKVTGAKATCAGKYKTHFAAGLAGDFTLALTVSDLTLGVQISESSAGSPIALPSSVALSTDPKCSVVVSNVDLHFSSTVLKIFEGPIDAAVKALVPKQVCDQVGVMIATKGQPLLDKLHTTLAGFLKPFPPPPPLHHFAGNRSNESFVAWAGVRVLDLLQDMLAAVAPRTHLQQVVVVLQHAVSLARVGEDPGGRLILVERRARGSGGELLKEGSHRASVRAACLWGALSTGRAGSVPRASPQRTGIRPRCSPAAALCSTTLVV